MPRKSGRPLLCGLLAVTVCACSGAGRPRADAEVATVEASASEIPEGHNRLALEMSPYLRQHATNPVDWYPWGPEALRKARVEDKPIFLSIGYSTCYWCHVMEEESFSDPEVAAALNASFVPIKVDREERPDLDEIYMTAVQVLTGRGGWPMSTWLTPEGKPFYGGTYFPKERFLALLERLSTAWRENRAQVLATAERVHARILARQEAAGSGAQPAEGIVERGVRGQMSRFDERHGGFAVRPKFPDETGILLLLAWYQHTGDAEALRMADETLRAMARGGIHDHLGGGFHRYAVDGSWAVPHFEKMLYNQAWLGRAYAEGWRLTGDAMHRRALEGIFDYVERRLTSPSGTFYSAEDAGHVGEEGEFYVWTPEQVREVLGPEDAKLFLARFGVTEKGNFEHGATVLHIARTLEALAEELDQEPAVLRRRLQELRARMRRARGERERPFRDEKILTGWNGMMIGTYARAGRLLERPAWVATAERSAEALLASNSDGELLLRATRGGEKARVAAFQEDYAWLVDGLLELYDATGSRRWLEEARRWTDLMVERFWDEEGGGFFLTAAGHDRLIARGKDAKDGAVPSGNSVAAMDLVRLAHRTGDPSYRAWAEGTMGAFAGPLDRRPSAYTFLLQAVAAGRRGEAGGLAWAALGTVRSEVSGAVEETGDASLSLRLAIEAGWHVNANPAGMPELVPTRLSIDAVGAEISGLEVAYPDGEEKSLAFAEETLRLYEGELTIPFRLSVASIRAGGGILHAGLRLQACNDQRCLAPETAILEIPLRP